MVCPTISGMIVDRRDQVLITRLSLVASRFNTFFKRCSSMKKPFFSERAISFDLRPYFRLRRRTIIGSVRLLLRVL